MVVSTFQIYDTRTLPLGWKGRPEGQDHVSKDSPLSKYHWLTVYIVTQGWYLPRCLAKKSTVTSHERNAVSNHRQLDCLYDQLMTKEASKLRYTGSLWRKPTETPPYKAGSVESVSKSWLHEKHIHDVVIKWKHFPRYWPFVWGIHRSPVNSPQKGQWRGALMSSLICVWIKGWVNNHAAGDLRCYRAHYDVTVMRAFHLQLFVIGSLHNIIIYL